MADPKETSKTVTPAPSTPPEKLMAVLVPEVKVTVIREDTPSKDTSREAKGSLGSGIADGLSTAASAVGALVSGISALEPAFAASIREATGYEDAVVSLDAVLKSTNNAAGMTKEGLLGIAEGYEQTTKFSDETVISAEKTMLTFTSIGKEAFPKAMQVALDLSAAVGQDLQSSVVQVGQALTDPIEGVADLEKAGVSFTKEQKNTIKALVETNKLGQAQDEILQVLKVQLEGAAAGAGSTFSGQLTILQNSFGDLLQTLGDTFLPLLKDLVQWVNREIMPAFKKWAEENAPAIQQALRDLAQWLKVHVLPAIQQLVQWVAANWPRVQQAIQQAWNIIQPILQALFQLWLAYMNALGQGLSQAWGMLQPIFQAFFAELSRFWTEIQPKLQAAWNRIVQVTTQAWQSVWNTIKPIIDSIQQFIQAHYTEIKTIIEGAMNFVMGYIQVVWSIIQGIIKIALDLISGDTTAATKSWDEMLTGVMDGLKKMFDGAWAAIQTTFALALQAIVDAITTKATEISTAMGNAISGAVTAITSRVADFFSAAAKLLLGENQDGNGGIVGGIRAVATQIATEMGSAINSAKDAITARIGDFFNAAKALIVGTEEEKGAGGLVGGIKSQVEAITSALGGAIDIAKGAIATRIGDFFNAAKELIVGTEEEKGAGGLVGGIKSKLEDVKKAIEDLISGAADKLATLPQDIKDKFADIGGKIVGGIKDKIAGMGDDLATALKSAIKAALETIRTALTSSDNPIAQAVTKQINDAIDWIEQKLGIASPSKVFAKIGSEMAAGLAEGFATPPLSATLAAGTMAMGSATANAIYNQQHYYNLTIHSNASTEQVVADFAMLRALAGA
jgi:phage-related protein